MSVNPNYKPSEGKREEFRKYLEKNGVMDALTKVLVNLYEEVDKPEDALEDKLALQAGLETHKQLMDKIEEATIRITELEQELDQLRASEGADNADEHQGSVADMTASDMPPAEEGEVPAVE